MMSHLRIVLIAGLVPCCGFAPKAMSERSERRTNGDTSLLAPFSGLLDSGSHEVERTAAEGYSDAFAPVTSLHLFQPENADQPEIGLQNPPFGPEHQRSWELPPVVVEGQAVSGLREEERIGSYGQPRWTATRRFPTTRVYVIPEGKVEVEGWARGTFKRSDQGGETEWRFLQEAEIGLPNRFQLDLYLRQDYDSASDETQLGGQFEVRYALADWGKLPGNPALYFEYIVLEERPDKIEPKLLLGDEFGEGWHWGANFVLEYELGGVHEAEYALTTAVSRTIVDEQLSLGIESVFAAVDEDDNRGDYTTSFVIGPSLQWRPVPNATINVAPLIGTTNDSPAAQVYLNAGWEF